MGRPEKVNMDQWDNEPGEVVSSPNAPAGAGADQAPAAGGVEGQVTDSADEFGYSTEGGPPPETPVGDLDGGEPMELPESPTVDSDALIQDNERLRRERENLQRLVGDQGRRLGDFERMQQMGAGAQIQPPAVDEDYYEEPLTRRDVDRIKGEIHQENFLMKVRERDNAFITAKNLNADAISAVDQFAKLRGIVSKKDAYGVMVYEGIIKEPEPEPRKQALRPARRTPTQVQGKRRAPTNPTVNMERYESMSAAEQEAFIRKKFYPESG